MYSDRPSKVTRQPCVHVEWRLKGKSIVESQGIYDVEQVIDFDHRQFWKAHLYLEAIDFRALGRQRRGAGRSKAPRVAPFGSLGPIDLDVRAGHLLARLSLAPAVGAGRL